MTVVRFAATGSQATARPLKRVAERDPWAAVDPGEVIHAAVGRLVDHPTMGRPGRVAGTRELVATGTPYVVVSQLEAAAVIVLRVLHSAQRWRASDRRPRAPTAVSDVRRARRRTSRSNSRPRRGAG